MSNNKESSVVEKNCDKITFHACLNDTKNLIQSMLAHHSFFFSSVHALLFLLRWLLEAGARLLWRSLYWIFLEMHLIISHTRIIRFLRHFSRIMLILLRQRFIIESLQWCYRPRFGDFLLLITAILLMFSGLNVHHDTDQPTFHQEAELQKSSLSTAESLSAQMHHSKQINVRLPAGQSLAEVWHNKGLLVQNSSELSEAFRMFFDARYIRQGQALDVEMEFAIPSGQSNRWRLRSMAIDFTGGYRLHLTPEQDVFGVLRFATHLQDKPIRIPRFAIEDTVEGLLLAGNDHVRGVPIDRTGQTGAPVYLESLLLFLDRSLETSGGLRSGDLISALYSLPQEGEPLRLLYARVRQPDHTLEMVHFQQEFDTTGAMYDDNGRAFVMSDWGEPLTAARITSGFGMRLHPVKKYSVMHQGIDFAAPTGTPVRATQAGIVLRKQIDPDGYGKWLQIKHEDCFTTLYAHLNGFERSIRRGYPVAKGQVIGFVGNTGLSTGPHLHYEVAHNGRNLDPRVITQPEQRLLSPRQRQNIKRILKQRRDQMQILLEKN